VDAGRPCAGDGCCGLGLSLRLRCSCSPLLLRCWLWQMEPAPNRRIVNETIGKLLDRRTQALAPIGRREVKLDGRDSCTNDLLQLLGATSMGYGHLDMQGHRLGQ